MAATGARIAPARPKVAVPAPPLDLAGPEPARVQGDARKTRFAAETGDVDHSARHRQRRIAAGMARRHDQAVVA